MTEDSPPITVVFAGQSERWAAWIEEVLTGVGLPNRLVGWDPLRTPAQGSALTELFDDPGRVLLVLDDWYLRFDSGRYHGWAEALRALAPEQRDRLDAVSVTARPLPDAVRDLNPVELRGVRREEARRRLLGLLGAAEAPVPVDLTRSLRFPDELPPVWNADRRNPRFTGRTTILERVRAALTAAPPHAPSLVALHGTGGVGKTQIALEYAYRHAGEYDVVWWVRAMTTSTARESLAALAEALGVNAGSELEALIDAVRTVLRAPDRRWLLVLDGAEAPEQLAGLLPDGPGHILLTGRRTTWARHGAELIEVPRFSRKESVAYACRRAPRLLEHQADALVHELDDLPLLVDQMAAWLDHHATVAVETYLHQIRNADPNVFGVVPSGDEPRPFHVVWSMAVNALYEDAPEAHELLKLLSFFSPDVVPVRLLRSARSADLPSHLASMAADPSSWNTALRTLSETTAMWLEYETGPPADTDTVGTLRMHRLFHRFVRSSLPPLDCEQGSATACRVLVSADPHTPTDPRHWQRYAELIPHLEPSGALESEHDDVRRLVLNCVEYLRTRGEYQAGWWISRRATENWRMVSGPTDPLVLVATHQHANMLRRLGRYADAEELGQTVLRDLAAAGVERRDVRVLRARNGLGGTLMALAEYEEADRLYAEAAEDAGATLGPRVPLTLRLRTNLATTRALRGHYAEALDEHQAVMRERVVVLGGRDQATLLSALHTAWTLRLLGRYQDALDYQEQNTRLHRQILDRNHTQTLLAEHNFALCMRREGNLGFARALMRSVHERLVSRRGGHHPETLLVSSDFAMLQRSVGDTGAALDLISATARRYAAQLGDDHPYTIGVRDNHALVLRDRGDATAARTLAEDCLSRMRDALGPDHPWSVGCALNTAGARVADGDAKGAAALGRDTLERARTAVGTDHVLTLNVQAALARDLHTLGEDEEAGGLEGDAVLRLVSGFGAEHAQVRFLRGGGRPYWDFEPQPY
ncbi:tetratricopeptide repeat protein [Streptomyces sp. MUM 203J]|uniref:FxSxx-COOH system tetratricopeptide repeat protein n=1 Tax=Streptomyces sp. MUM 203J TaxID=2791990 RepID=UPI001F03F959|nr:FxSxx-COOH system tetratricopeptide repeat protein [Streptomyces sp. MUM 203J]MCH0538243.1 tetratricopeptide repeat protein [Streptomyces sp. MUM 203J]